MRRASVGCKDSSGPVGFDYQELHFFTPPEIGPENLNPESNNQQLGAKSVNRESKNQKLWPKNVDPESKTPVSRPA